jgi:ribosomal protein S14
MAKQTIKRKIKYRKSKTSKSSNGKRRCSSCGRYL